MDGMDKNKTFLIVGLGLLGGKYAQVLSQKGYRVTGITHSQSTLDYALEHAYICEGRPMPCRQRRRNGQCFLPPEHLPPVQNP